MLQQISGIVGEVSENLQNILNNEEFLFTHYERIIPKIW